MAMLTTAATIDDFLGESHQGKTLIEHAMGRGLDEEHARATITAVRSHEEFIWIETDNEDAFFRGIGLSVVEHEGGVWRLYSGPFYGVYYSVVPREASR